MSRPLAIASIIEAVTGGLLALQPALVSRLLLGAEAVGMAVVVARVAGVALVSLSIACWPGRSASRAPLVGMFVYTTAVMAYLTWLGIRGDWVGPALWPAVAVHAALCAALPLSCFSSSRKVSTS